MEILDFVITNITRVGDQSWALSLLQVVGIWTLVAFITRAALTALPDRFHLLHYHVRLAMLYSLPLMIIAAWLATVVLPPIGMIGPVPLEWWSAIVITASGAGTAHMDPEGSASLVSMMVTLPFMTGVFVLLAAFLAFIGGVRMAFQVHSIRNIRNNAGRLVMKIANENEGQELISSQEQVSGQDQVSSQAIHLIEKLSRQLGITKRVALYRHSDVAVPVTMGWRRPLIILPQKTYEEHELKLILHHELVHIRRGHFLLRVLEEGVKNLFFFHPLVHLLAREITAWREMTCDSELLASSEATDREYASLLYRTIPERGSIPPPALSASITNNPDIKKRIKTMTHYPREFKKWSQRRSSSIALAIVFIIPVLLFASCDFGTAPDAEEEEVFTVIESMPEPVGGMAAIFENLTYPESARRAGIEGRVIVEFTVDELGNLEDPVVVQGIGGGCDEAAVAAIEAVEWIPGTQRGEPVSTSYSLPITFRMDAGGEGASDG